MYSKKQKQSRNSHPRNFHGHKYLIGSLSKKEKEVMSDPVMMKEIYKDFKPNRQQRRANARKR